MARKKEGKLFGRGWLNGWMRREDEPEPEEAEQIEERRPAWSDGLGEGPSWTDGEDGSSAWRRSDAADSRETQMPYWTEPEDEQAEERAPRASEGRETPSPSWREQANDDEAADMDEPADGQTDGEGTERRSRLYQRQVNRDEADQAWDREAQRVESSQPRRGPIDDAEEDGQASDGDRKGKGRKKSNRFKKRTAKQRSDSEERKSFVRTICVVLVCGILFLMVALMVASNFISSPWLALPRKIVTTIVTPVQGFFSGITDDVVNYLRMLKIRGSLEDHYNELLIQLDECYTELAQMEELRFNINSLQQLINEQDRNREMNPVTATVIGHDTSNYFSTLTLNVGSQDGVSDYMAVVAQGGLVGVTYNVTETKCQVRCIIDSDCTVPGLVQSSRDQGSVKGTLGTTGEPMCRMYYLPDSSLPRPGDVVVTSGVGLEFPKGIPIGYIRESTRGMEDNKSYVVLEPVVDFQHLEYVTVYCYRPTYAEEAQTRMSTSSNLRVEVPSTARPVPTWSVDSGSNFILGGRTIAGGGAPETPAPTPAVTPTPTPAATPSVGPDATNAPENLTYQAANLSGITPSPSPRPTNTPSPTPVPTPDPGAMTMEDDE